MKRNFIKVQKSCQNEKYKKPVIIAVDSKGMCCSSQEVEQDVLSCKHYEHASIFIVLRKYYIYTWKDEEQQTKTSA